MLLKGIKFEGQFWGVNACLRRPENIGISGFASLSTCKASESLLGAKSSWTTIKATRPVEFFTRGKIFGEEESGVFTCRTHMF